MSSKHRYLLNRDGRYFARIVIPKPLRAFLGNKSELREPLGPDRRTAIAHLATAVSALQGRVAVAERKAQIANGEPITPGRYPLSADQMALRNYNERIAFDLELRNATDAYAQVNIDDRMIELLREGGIGQILIKHARRGSSAGLFVGRSNQLFRVLDVCMRPSYA